MGLFDDEDDEVQASGLFDDDADDDARGRGLLDSSVHVPSPAVVLNMLAHNPYNPREELTDLKETAASLTAKGQIQPLTVVTRKAFLAVHPTEAEAIGAAAYIVIEGNRRLAAARLAGLSTLRIDVNDALATSAADLLESALIANIHRVDVPPMDQARGVQELLATHRTQAKVAQRLGKTEAWVSQRLTLLNLTPELQRKLDAGELKVEHARKIGRLAPEEQNSAAREVLNAVKTPRRRRSRKDAVGTPSSGSAADGGADDGLNGVKSPIPAQRAKGASEIGTLVIPAGPPVAIVNALVAQLEPAELAAVARLLGDRLGQGSGRTSVSAPG